MTKKWILSLVCASALLNAETPSQETPPKTEAAYDADLFKRDTSAFSLHAGFLFWRVQEGALDYALKMQHAAPAGTSYAQGKFHSATFDGEPGFRVTASYFRAPKMWEVWGQYTRLTARGENSVDTPEETDRFLTGTWPQEITAPLTRAHSSIHMNYNVADLLVDRYFNPNPHMRLRLLGGGTVAWIKQTWQFSYENALNESTLERNSWKFIGGGFRVGTVIDWFWGYNMYITATATCGTLIGSYDNEAKQTVSTESSPVRDTHFSDVRPIYTVQAIFGPSWQKNFACARMEIFAGYELNTWFNLHEVYRSDSAVANGTKQTFMNSSLVALQGLTTRMTVDF